MEEKITLDRKAFKVLASDTRIDILKHLNIRRMTLTELSRRLGMSASTVKEHMENLSSAGLVEQKDDGHKWKYYELTGKGKNIVNPVERKVFFVLGLSLVIMLAGFYSMFSNYMTGPITRAAQTFGDSVQPPMLGAAESLPAAGPAAFPVFEIAVVSVSILVVGLSLGYLVTRRRLPLLA